MKIPRYFTTVGKSPYDGIEFEARGAHELKGVPGEWELFAVAS